MPMFPERFIAELLSRTDLVALVSEYTLLEPKGRRFWGCCPFHSEKTPSFSIQPDKQLYYCFGCHAGGSAVQFVMDKERMPFAEAIEFLAGRAGMELPNVVDDERARAEQAKRNRMYDVCRDAALFYVETLSKSTSLSARAYIAKRGISQKLCRAFGIGYAPKGWDGLVKHLRAKNYTDDEIILAGLAGKSNADAVYDIYRNRIIFPIISERGKVVGFGARAIEADDKPKYINTGETPIYSKRNMLYALNMLRGKSLDDIIICEGYLDVIALHSVGINNAVASLGTALTPRQAQLIKRYTGNVYIAYDGDAAGQKAMLRGLDILKSAGLNVRVIMIPDGQDPDDYVKKHGKDGFLALKDAALTIVEYKLFRLSLDYDLTNVNDREMYAKKACELISSLEPVEVERYLRDISRRTGLSVDTLKAQCNISNENNSGNDRYNSEKRPMRDMKLKLNDEETKLMISLLACMLKGRDVGLEISRICETQALDGAHALKANHDSVFADADIRLLVEKVIEQYRYEQKLDIAILSALAAQHNISELLIMALNEAETIDSPIAVAHDCLKGLRMAKLKEEYLALIQRAKTATDSDKGRLIQQISQLAVEINKLKL